MGGGHPSSMIRKTDNTYEAAFYLMFGAIVDNVRISRLNNAQAHKKMFRNMWIIELSNVPEDKVREWGFGTATANIRDYESARKKLKKLIIKRLYS